MLYIVLAWYCDEVVPSEYGVKRSVCFCVKRQYWCGGSGAGGGGGSGSGSSSGSSGIVGSQGKGM